MVQCVLGSCIPGFLEVKNSFYITHGRETERQKDSENERQTDMQAGRHAGGRTEMQKDRQTEGAV